MPLITSPAQIPLLDALADLCELHRELLQNHFLNPRPNKTAMRRRLGLKRTKLDGVVCDEFDDTLVAALGFLREAMRRRGIGDWVDLPE